MKGFIRKTLSGWVPADEQSQEMHKRQKAGQIYRADIVQPRNYRHHCLFMSLLDLTFQNQDTYENPKEFRRYVAWRANHCETFMVDGVEYKVPLAYSYDEIPDENDFTTAFSAAMTVCAHLMHDMDLGELEAEVGRYADEHYGRAVA